MRVKDDKKHEAICSAAIELITTKGFADTSMSKIAKAAGVSPATIYVYFENKEDLLNKLYLMVKQEKSIALMEGIDLQGPVKEVVLAIWKNFYNYAIDNPVRFAFAEQFLNSPLVNRISRDEGMSFYQPLIDLFERGKSEGVLKEFSMELFGAFAFAPLMALIKQHHAGEIVLDEDALEKVLGVSWDTVSLD